MTDLLKIVRARWAVILLVVVVALATGWVTISFTGVQHPAAPAHTASSVLLNSPAAPTSGAPRVPLSAMAAIVEIDALAKRVADKVGFDGNPASLAAQVNAEGDEQSGLLTITATAGTAGEAKALADAYAEELIAFLIEQRNEDAQARIDALKPQVDQLRREIEDLDRQIASNPGQAGGLETQRNQTSSTLAGLLQQQSQARSTMSEPLGLEVIQKAIAQVAPSEVFQPPRSRLALTLISLILGLLAGIGVAVLLERTRTPIRTRQEAEMYFGTPVLAEIPTLNREERDSIVSVVNPRSPSAEAFRLLEAGMDRSSAWNGKGSLPSDAPSSADDTRVIAITSSSPGEGKTTVVANLASAIAERGKRVVILSCDFRHPRIHRLLGVPNAPGLAEAIRSSDIESAVNDYAVTTLLKGVSVVPSGTVLDTPGELLGTSEMRAVLKSARTNADVVLVDTAPVLWAADAAHLVPEVDAVLLVARSGQTKVDVAKRTTEMMKLLKVPLVGVVLNATPHGSFQRSYYDVRQDTPVPQGDGQAPDGRREVEPA